MRNSKAQSAALPIRVPRKRLSEFCQRYQIRRLALFGSVLRSDFRADSDIDILVAFQPGAKISFMTFGRMQRELQKMFKRSVDLVPEDGLKPVIRADVLASAQEVYEARDTLPA